ncbi:MAG TPA: AAA family ATPase, partial [Acidimicrobiia bacterium]|nr:AAA family ATPase [Acidimicrobiia bacterium]
MHFRRRTPHLIGREQPLRALRGFFESADRVRPIALVTGEAGIGKTRLLDEFASLADPAVVVRGGCVEDVAYAPWVDALWWVLEASSLSVVDGLSDRTRARLGRLLPQLATDDSTGDEDNGQQLLFEAVLDLLGAVASTTELVVVIDDIHWIDPASADLLRYLAENVGRVAVRLVVAYRPEESNGVSELLEDLERAEPLHIDLEPLAEDAVTQIASYLLEEGATEAALRRIIETADGNPLFVEELVAAVQEEHVPHTLRDLMLVRFNALGDDACRLVRIAAIIGARVSKEWLLAATEFPIEQAISAANEAVDAGILIDEHNGADVTFRHDLLRRSVISDLVADELVVFHRAIARALTDHPERATEADYVAELARHWDAAEQAAPALKWMVAAGRRADETYAFEAATSCYERALVWWDEADAPVTSAGIEHTELLLAAARANATAGHVDRGAELGRVALDETVALPPNEAIDAVARLYPIMWTADRAAELFEFASEHLEAHLDRAEPKVRAHYLVKRVMYQLGRTDDAETRRIAARLLEDVEDVDDPGFESNVHEVMARCYEAWGEVGKVDGEYELAASLARTAENFVMLTVIRYNHACYKLAVGDVDGCRRLLEDVDELVKQYGLRRFLVPAACLRIVVLCLQGDLDGAREGYGRLVHEPLQGYDAWFRAYAGSLLTLFSGDFGTAVAMLQPETVGVDAVTDADFGVEMAIVSADALTWMGDLGLARRAAESGLARLQDFYEISSHGWITMVAMRVAADTADADRADALDEAWRNALANANAVSPLLRAYSAAAEYEHLRARGHDSFTLARAAASEFASLGYGYYATYFRWREAHAVLGEGDRRIATELLA